MEITCPCRYGECGFECFELGLEGFDDTFGAVGTVEGLESGRYRNDGRIEDVATGIPLCG